MLAAGEASKNLDIPDSDLEITTMRAGGAGEAVNAIRSFCTKHQSESRMLPCRDDFLAKSWRVLQKQSKAGDHTWLKMIIKSRALRDLC